MKLISENYDFDRKFEICVKNYEDCDLYVNTTGYAYLKFFDTGKIKPLMPNKNGYIFVKGKKINLKRWIFKITYPKISLKNKVVVALGQSLNVLNLIAISKNQYRNLQKHKMVVVKNQNTGEFTTNGRNEI